MFAKNKNIDKQTLISSIKNEMKEIRKKYIPAFEHYYKTGDYTFVEMLDKKYYELLSAYNLYTKGA
ncbi:hypothetical protein ACAG39_01725 [Caldicellulosiruptoraceae bacterium PP1]